MESLKEKIKLIRWLWSDRYEATLNGVLHPGAKKDLLGVMKIARKRFPFLNKGYFGNYEKVKQDAQELWGIDVKEVELPDYLLGVFMPEEECDQSVILINKKKSPLFKLTTLSHELSHAPAMLYYNKKHRCKTGEIRIRNRVTIFSDALKDKEEVMADVLTSLGAYPKPDFERFFAKGRFNFWSLVKSYLHMPRHYPELITGFLRFRDILLNIALSIHFLKLRFFLYKRFGL